MAKSKQIKGRDHWGKGKNGWPCGEITTPQIDYLAPTLQGEFDKSMKCMRCPEPIMAEANCQDCKLETEEEEVEVEEVPVIQETELVFEVDGKLLTSSLLVANKFGKQHKHVIDSIRELLRTAENSALLSYFIESTYMSVQNKELPMFLMNRDGFSLLVMRFTGAEALKFQIEYIQAFNKMESYIKQQFQIPQSFSEALRLAAAQQEQIEEQAKRLELQQGVITDQIAKIEEAKPKEEFYKVVSESAGCIDMSTLARICNSEHGVQNIGRGRLLEFLRYKQVLLSGNSTWNKPQQYYMENGWFRYRSVNTPAGIKYQPLVTGKGQPGIVKMIVEQYPEWLQQNHANG